MLPGEFAPWQTVYHYFRRWRREGRLQCLLSALRRTVRREEGREGEPSALIVDCQSVPTSRAGGIASYDAYKNVKGRKRHLAVDTEGLPWNVLVHAAGDHESQWTLQVLNIVEREDEGSGFSVDPKRSIVERTFSWLGGWRRLNRDYERNTDSSETMVRTALLRIALNRLG